MGSYPKGGGTQWQGLKGLDRSYLKPSSVGKVSLHKSLNWKISLGMCVFLFRGTASVQRPSMIPIEWCEML